MQVDEYLRHFSRDQLLVVVTEELARSQAAVMRGVYDFLDVDPDWTGAVMEKRFNRTDIKSREAIPQAPPRVLSRRTPPAVRRAYDATLGTIVRGGRPPRDPRTAVVSDRVRAQLEARLHDDVARLRQLMPASFDGWGIT